MPNLQIDNKFANRYLLKKLIGVGGYSQVWLAEDTKSGNLDIALKIFAPGQGLDDKGLELFSKEYALVFNLNHPGLLKPTYFDDFEGSPYLVMQYCQQGSVFGKIGEMTELELAHFIQQSTSALNYLHQQDPPIIHQDIKPDNFLIDNQGNYLLADFGISSKIRRTLTKSIGAQASTGTLAYMPPEKFSADKQIIKAGDIFSLGVTMYELLTGDLPFGDNGGLTLKAGADVPNLPTNFSPDLNRLLISCMAKDPWERPPAEKLEAAAVGFLQNSHWPSVGKAVPNPTLDPIIEPEKPQIGRKTQLIIETETLLRPMSEPVTVTKIEPENIINYTPWIIFCIVCLIGIVISFVLPKGPSIEERYERARQDSIAMADSLAYAQSELFSMVYVKGGTFDMGSKNGSVDEEPLHSVTLSDFFIGKYEVTQKQWRDIIGNNPSNFVGCDDCPVENVSYYDVQKFISILNGKTGKVYRLPTEAEWEYAAKGGNISMRYYYSGSHNVEVVAWYKENSDLKTHNVGQKQTNELGLFDMSGNVWEWCSDWFDKYNKDIEFDPTGPFSGSKRIIRGGDFYNDALFCSSTNRSSQTPNEGNAITGFRLASVSN